MKGSEIMSVLKGILSTTVLRELSTKDTVEVKHLVDPTNFSLFSCNPSDPDAYKAANTLRLDCRVLKDLASDLESIACNTGEVMTEEAALCRYHLSQVPALSKRQSDVCS